MHPQSWVSSSPSDMVGNSEVAIAIEWNWYSEWAPEEVVVSSIPGATGRSLSGCLMAAITKHTRRKDVAFDILRQIVKNRPAFETSTRPWNGGFRDETTEPVHKDTLNATMWPKYCTGQPRLCKAYETYPEKFEAPMIQRLRGCGPLFDRCINVVATGWTNLMVEHMQPAQVVATMDAQLRAVMGIPTSGDEAAGTEEWTAERIALIVVVIVAGFWTAVLAWFTHDKLSGLRKSNGLRLPASVVLGVAVLILFGIVQVIITLEWNTAVRRISEDLGAQVQVELLKTARLSIERSAEDKLEGDQMALSQMKSLIKADYVSQLPSMRIDPRSLILLIDLDEETIVVSSDTRKQADKVSIDAPYSDEVTNWMHAAFDAVGPTMRGFKTEQLYSSAVGSEKVNLNLQSVSLQKEYNPGDFKEMNYVLIYFVPEEVVYEETNKSLNRAVNLSILLAIVGVVLLVTTAIFSTLPLIRLAMDMEEVRSMRMDNIDLTQNSRLIEFSSLIVGFQAMCEMLIEYKSFMPKTLFNVGSDDDEESELVSSVHLSKQSRTRSSALGSSRNLSDSITQYSKVTRQQLQVGEAAINQTRGTLLAVRLLLDEGKDMAVKSFETLLAAIERSIGNGVLHSFNTTAAEELIVTWGVAGNPMSLRTTQERAAYAALGIKHLMSAENTPVTMVAISGRLSAGNVGSKKTRGFAVFGSPVRLLPTMTSASKCISQTMSATTIVVNTDMSNTEGFSFTLVDSVISKNGTLITLHELVGKNQVHEQEWMYQLQEMEQVTRTFETYLEELLSKTEADLSDLSKVAAVPSDTVSEQINAMQKIRMLLDPSRMLNDILICSLIERRSAVLVAEESAA
ncbi:hypothetical protein DIPPA_15891 [Diplonema papillatum]|nr:hypothetical protein DIPPA_15891 [Diplonema papillatum]